MPGKSSWSSVFPATLKGAVDAGLWLDTVAAAAAFPEDLSFRVHLCVEELFTNVVRHGGGVWTADAAETASPVSVTIGIALAGDELSVILEDNGKPFDVSAAPAKSAEGDLEAVQPGGLGIKLVKEFSADLTYGHAEGMNRTALKFLWPKSTFSLQ